MACEGDRRRTAARIWRRLRSALGVKKRQRRSRPRTEDDRAVAWLWPYLALTTSQRYPPLYENRDALILQMGRVASISIQEGMRRRGYNAYHTHGISASRRLGLLKRLERNNGGIASINAMGSHLAAVAHYELLRWYQRHKRRNGERLRIITLTRDPVSWMTSHLVLRKSVTVPPIRRWHAVAAGSSSGPDDELSAIRAFGAALGRMILQVGPTPGPKPAMATLRRIAAEHWPGDENFTDLAWHALGCGRWFEDEIEPVFGFDLLTEPALRETGVGRRETDYAEILVLRFEDLARNVQVLGDFLGLPGFALPHANATPSGGGEAVRAALEAGIEQAGGPAVRHMLRATEYAKACGYDRLTS